MDGVGFDLDRVVDEVDAVLRRSIDSEEVLGLTWSVAHGGAVRSGAIGHLDAERGEPVRVDSIFRISSLTKPMTAAATMMLVDEGDLVLEDPVDEWLPELADRRVLSFPSAEVDDTVPAVRPITVDDLLTFRLGFGLDFADFAPKPIDAALGALDLGSGPPAPAGPPAPDEWIRRLGSVPLQCQPGERWLYHTGADVLGVLIARVVGRPFDEFLRERLFGPLGMVDTGFSVPAGSIHRFGACFGGDDGTGARSVYDPVDGQWSVPPAFPGGGAGLVSTVADVARFAEMLRNHGTVDGAHVLSSGAVSAMTTNHLTHDQLARGGPDPHGELGWGLGLGVQIGTGGPLPRGTYGWDGGLGSVWRTDPVRDTTGIVLTNQMWTSPEPPPVCADFLELLGSL